MRCPYCHADKEHLKVIDSRTCDGGRSIRRRRQCLNCSKRFTTYERIEEHVRLTVVKRDGRRVPWDRNKIITGLARACFKRPVPESELARIADEVEDEVFRSHDREVSTTVIGSLVADKLRRVDQVAYVRFASVYRQFKTLEELVEEARAVLDAKRFEDPSQGRLFIEPEAAVNGPARDNESPAPAPQGKLGPRARRKAREIKQVQPQVQVPSNAV
ncbi:transcriptional regulator NrdR [Fontivita pretiosa]|uniref:transcriptional regulator NrdR n=1 Tax=Fontivita pretiosa TaxID=2989684 RepID=UPI003D177B4E